MKYTRLDLQSGLSKNTIKNIIIFFIVIPIIAISIGRIVTGTVIVPYVNKRTQPVQYTFNMESSIKEIDYYIIQAGVFMNIKNAEVLQRGINQKNRSSFIVNDGDSFRVIVEISEDKKSIMDIEEDLKNSGYACIISNFKFNSNFTDIQLSESINIIIDIIKIEQNLIANSDNGKEALLKQINNNKDKLGTIYEKIKTEKKGTNSSLNNYGLIIKNLDEFILNIENKKMIEAKSNMTNQLYSLKKIYDEYSKSK